MTGWWRTAQAWLIRAAPGREYRMMRLLLIVALLAGAATIACTQADQDDTSRTGVAPAGTVSAGPGDASGTAPAGTASTGRGDASGSAGGTNEEREPAAPLTIHFSRGESTVEVMRDAPPGRATLDAALRQLLRGPTESERAAGIHSWFSDTTAGALRFAAVDDAGRAIVDFADLRELIPNASTSAGSGMLLRELNATVFEFADVQSVEYRMEGSCAQFFEWLQYQCETMTRP